MKYLSETIDIHGGGLENQFPHHECEIAQSEGATGRPFVRYWLHNNMVTVDGRKMGKSLGNFITLKDAFKRWHPQVIRFFILQSHYRSTLDFSNDAVEAAGKGLDKLTTATRLLEEAMRSAPAQGPAIPVDLAGHRTAFLAAMDDDFNTPQAIAVLFDVAREVNASLSQTSGYAKASLVAVQNLYDELGGRVLGLSMSAVPTQAGGDLTDSQLMDLILAVRGDVR